MRAWQHASVALVLVGLAASIAAQSTLPDANGDDSAPNPRALRRSVDDILAKPAYREALAQKEEFDLLRWLQERWWSLGGLQDASTFGFYTVVIGLSVVLAALVAHIIYTIARSLRRRRGPPMATVPVVAQRALGPEELIAQADDLAGQGDFRGAIRHLYLALVRALQMRRILPRTKTQTNGEHVRQLAAHPTLRDLVRPFASMFDEKWYGGGGATADDVDQCRTWLGAALVEVETE